MSGIHILPDIFEYLAQRFRHLAHSCRFSDLWSTKTIWEFLPECGLYHSMCYFMHAYNRQPVEFGQNLQLLLRGLEAHKSSNPHFAALYSMLVECPAEMEISEPLETRVWQRWLKKMDYVFKHKIIWVN